MLSVKKTNFNPPSINADIQKIISRPPDKSVFTGILTLSDELAISVLHSNLGKRSPLN